MGRDFKRCYDRELLESPVATGAFRIRATIESAGNVESVVLLTQSGNLSAALLRCCANVVRSRWFARPQGGGATVELPLKFTPDPKPVP